MDDLRFDRLARVLGQAGNRREGLKAALGGLFGLGAAGAALDGALEADARRRDRSRGRRDEDAPGGTDAAGDGHGDGADGERRKRKKGCKPACGAGYTCVKTGKKRKKRFTCQCLSGVTCGEACCAEGQACEGDACTGGPGPEPGSCHEMGEFCKQTGRPCCPGMACGSGQGGEDDIGCWIPKGGRCASTAECTWGTECRDGVCSPLQCGPGNCDGCCTTTIYGACIGGRDQTDAQCGAGGAICGACPVGKVCREKACVCAPGTKPCGDGCIPDASCCTDGAIGCPTNETCRVNDRGNGRCECGDTGVSCPPSGQVCGDLPNDDPDLGFICLCGNVECPANEICANGACSCGGGATCGAGTECVANRAGGFACSCGSTGNVCSANATCTSGACQCGAGYRPCGKDCIPTTASAEWCCENGISVQPGQQCPTTGLCNGATGNCECGDDPPAVCGQNSFCDQAGACQCPANAQKCGTAPNQVCCAAFETCIAGECITTAALCGGQLCGAGEGCCNGTTCTSLSAWGGQQQEAVTTFATGCMPGITCTPAPATNASRIPFYVYVAPDGLTAWVSEQVNERVSVWTRPNATSLAWMQQTTFGGRCPTPSTCSNTQFRLPYSVVASFDGLTAWVADSENNRVSVWKRSTPSGTDWTWQANFGGGCTAVAICTASQLWKPGAVAVSTDTLTAWVTDTGRVGTDDTTGRGSNGRVQVWTRPDADSTFWTHQGNIGTYGTGENQFRRPRGIFVSPDEQTMWIADDQNHRVAVYTYQGPDLDDWTEQTTFGSCTNNPLSNDCTVVACIDDSQLHRPLGVVASLDGNTAYVSDFCNNRVSVWKRKASPNQTEWEYLAKFGLPLTSTNALTGFDEPRGVWVAGDACTAWVADTQNQRISIWKAGN